MDLEKLYNQPPAGARGLEVYNHAPYEAVQHLGWSALEAVWRQYQPDRQDWIHRRTGRIASVLESFGRQLPKEVGDIVFLYETTSALDLDHGNNSREVVEARQIMVEDYLTDAAYSHDQFDYVWSILGDLDYMNNEANNYRSRVNTYQQGAVDSRFKEAIQDSYSQEILPDFWLTKAETLDVNLMERVLEEVNLEAVIVKSAQLIDDMNKHPEHSDVEMFHKINEAEYFYAPICEIIGFDGMAASLVDLASQIRFEKAGRTDILDRARQLHQQAATVEIQQVLNLIGDTGLDSEDKMITEQVAGQKRDGTNWVNFGDFVLNISDQSRNTLGVYRFKTVGSIANKIFRKEHYKNSPPCDLVAATIISRNSSELSQAFGGALGNLQETEVLMTTASRKTAPIFIQSTQERADSLEQIALARGYKTQKEIVDQSKFQVAKMTFLVSNQQGEGVGVEIQFLTIDERRRARTKEASHIIYRYGQDLNQQELQRLISLMERTKARRQHMEKTGVKLTSKPESLARVQQTWPGNR